MVDFCSTTAFLCKTLAARQTGYRLLRPMAFELAMPTTHADQPPNRPLKNPPPTHMAAGTI